MEKYLFNYFLPSFWASYLINGDASGYSDEEINDIQNHVRNLGYCTDVDFENNNFMNFCGIGHEVCKFTFYNPPTTTP